MATTKIIREIRNNSNPSYVEKLLFIKHFDTINLAKNRVNFNKSEKTRLTKRYKKLRPFVTPGVHFKHLNADQLDALDDKRFNTTGRGIFIMRPVDSDSKPIPGVRMRVNQNGTVVITKGPRTDYIVPVSKRDITALINSKPNINNVVIKRIFVDNPGLAKKYRAALPKDRSIQLMYETHRSNPIFKTIGALNNYIESMSKNARENLTALAFVIFTKPKTKTKTKTKQRGKKIGKTKK